MRTISAAAAVLVLIAGGLALAQREGAQVAAIRRVLDAQVQAWNAHNLEGFMAGYWHSPELSFFSGGSQTYGWEQTLARYQNRYQSAGAAMGTLEFSDLSIQPLGREAAFVRGRFHLKMAGKDSSGIFTLIFRHFPEGWKIVHDHTSTD